MCFPVGERCHSGISFERLGKVIGRGEPDKTGYLTDAEISCLEQLFAVQNSSFQKIIDRSNPISFGEYAGKVILIKTGKLRQGIERDIFGKMELNIIFNGGALRRKAVRCIQGEPVAYETLDFQEKNGHIVLAYLM